MHQKECSICGRPREDNYGPTSTHEYNLIFHEQVCRLCGLTLARGFAGIVEMLRQSHGEKRERVIDRLIERLKLNGFDTDRSFTSPGRRRAG